VKGNVRWNHLSISLSVCVFVYMCVYFSYVRVSVVSCWRTPTVKGNIGRSHLGEWVSMTAENHPPPEAQPDGTDSKTDSQIDTKTDSQTVIRADLPTPRARYGNGNATFRWGSEYTALLMRTTNFNVDWITCGNATATSLATKVGWSMKVQFSDR